MPEGTFDIYYSEEKPAETVADKKQRREMEKNYGIRNEIDFAVEDLEVSREEAVAIVAKNFGYGEEITEEELIQNLNSKNVSSFASKLRGLNVSNQSQV